MTKLKAIVGLWAVVFCVVSPCIARANTSSISETSNLCEMAAVAAAQTTGVPLEVLRAIALTETGRHLAGQSRSWPWTVNMEGDGRWFDDRATAEAYSKKHFARGARSFDVGCFQINYRWHGQAFPSIEAMFDPQENALYAARFLLELHTEFGNWVKAAGAYHSRTPKFARRYEARFEEFLANLLPVEIAQPVTQTVPKAVKAPNTFPFMQQTSERGSMASLVPLNGLAAPRLIDISDQ